MAHIKMPLFNANKGLDQIIFLSHPFAKNLWKMQWVLKFTGV